ncbi:MAG: hypothetical protein ACW99G_03620 [Candidatus Thorarchaeota archaeon]|jgi:hypothetical protein
MIKYEVGDKVVVTAEKDRLIEQCASELHAGDIVVVCEVCKFTNVNNIRVKEKNGNLWWLKVRDIQPNYNYTKGQEVEVIASPKRLEAYSIHPGLAKHKGVVRSDQEEEEEDVCVHFKDFKDSKTYFFKRDMIKPVEPPEPVEPAKQWWEDEEFNELCEKSGVCIIPKSKLPDPAKLDMLAAVLDKLVADGYFKQYTPDTDNTESQDELREWANNLRQYGVENQTTFENLQIVDDSDVRFNAILTSSNRIHARKLIGILVKNFMFRENYAHEVVKKVINDEEYEEIFSPQCTLEECQKKIIPLFEDIAEIKFEIAEN